MSNKRHTTERFHTKTSYSLYCVNIHGSGLKAIKDEFKKQVLTGLRQTLFVVDLDELQEDLNNQKRNSKIRKDLKANNSTDLINVLLQHIQAVRKDYEGLTKKINEELKFDLYEYWLQNTEKLSKIAIDNTDKSKQKDKAKAKTKENKTSNEDKEDKLACISTLITRQHTRVGQPTILSQRKYIKDEPTLDKLYIIILGQMRAHFYADLLRRDQPLEGIVNFIPTESNYDIMLGNNKLRNFIRATLEVINSSIYQIRQEVCLKPVGIFNHNLPVISNCLASKHSREIYDQLTWCIYDIDMLKQQYQMFYYGPYQVTDVGIPASTNLTQMYHVAESLSIQGYFGRTCLPISCSDLSTIAAYLNSLLNTCGLPEHLTRVAEPLNSNISLFNHNLRNAFSSVTKIPKYDRLVVAENNELLLNMLQYADPTRYHSIRLCCLDYYILRQYSVFPSQQLEADKHKMEHENFKNIESLTLPKYVKYYANSDCSGQRITELCKQFDDYKIQELSPGYKLYTFKRFYNILHEYEGRVTIPTRLCFRDFTLYRMEEFLQDLKTAKLNSDSLTDNSSNEKKVKTLEFDENIFIRPNSLKANKLQTERYGGEENKSRKSETRSNRSKNEKKSSLTKSSIQIEEYVGLPRDHHLLKGYNLEDTLQEVKYKISKYYYQQGFVQLYEERWCFQDMNKELILAIHNTTIFICRPRPQLKGLGNNLRLLTNNNISVRILNDDAECSKIVMNYPNGLSVFHQTSYCEQIWHCEQSPRDELRRIYTTLGAVIILFKSNDLIMILRYNGEVYRLYQHELAAEEEEELGFTSDLDDVQEKSSGFTDLKAQGDSWLIQANPKFEGPTKTMDNTTIGDKYRQEKQRDKFKNIESEFPSLNNKRSRQSKKLLSEESLKISRESNSASNKLRSSIDFEQNFLNLLCSGYGLKYLHLIVTTSQGRRIHLTHQGEIFEGLQCSKQEWHDYFANESYCERSDGVKMIWSQDCFKCFHKDGTVFKTTIEEVFEKYDVDEFESQISESSSHDHLKEEVDEDRELDKHFTQTGLTLGKLKSLSTYTITETAEEYTVQDLSFISYYCNSWNMQHQNYAEVYVLIPNYTNLNSFMEIIGISNIRLYIHTEPLSKREDPLTSEGEEYMTTSQTTKVVVNVWIGENVHVTADKETCEIYARMYQSKTGTETKSDSLTFSFKYTDCINDVFEYLLNEIASFESQNNGHKMRELFYIEKINADSSIRGFEFFSSLPELSQYSYHVSNNITELKAVNTINELMSNNCGYKEDLHKFPRFKTTQKKHPDLVDVFPRVLSAK